MKVVLILLTLISITFEGYNNIKKYSSITTLKPNYFTSFFNLEKGDKLNSLGIISDDSSDLPPKIILLTRSGMFTKYKMELLDSLNNRKVPQFIYNECLDFSKEVTLYRRVNSEQNASLRYDLINSMNYKQLCLLSKIIDRKRVKGLCDIALACNYCNHVPYSDLSTLALIRKTKRKKNR